MYTIKPVKSDQVDNEKFVSALTCARDSVESVLFDHGMTAAVLDNNSIIITPLDGESVRLSLSECKELIKQCFIDSTGEIYPEFEVIDACATAT